MAKFTMEQVQKWNAGAGEGWRLDLQALAVWNEKVLVFDGEEDEKGEFYRLTRLHVRRGQRVQLYRVSTRKRRL